MSNLSELIKKYTINHNKKIKKICAPLVDRLEISVFSYYVIEPYGRYCILSNYPEQVEWFFQEKLYTHCPYTAHPSLFRSGCALIPVTMETYYKQKSREKYELDHLFLMTKKTGLRLEGFIFARRHLVPSQCQVFLEQIDLLNKFGNYFKKESSALINKALSDGYDMSKAKGDAYYTRDLSLPLSNKNPIQQKFLREITLLSLREMECLDLFKQGYSAQGTAAIIGISPRTVESYFESIKNKLNCSSKWDLLAW